ncbi:16S rRNA (cytosine(1402)-N(4))-methyltransferase RsmH [Candidatus Parcubacteria bacterium]|nr:16S rRNA (cytosine(1402)-N(4))-methyltransferase RsmH [Candidatus Parcubacteria bacterium]
MFNHIPVLLNEVLEYLDPEPNRSFIDGTVGQGGHAEAILQRVTPVVRQSSGRLLAIDRDAANLAIAKQRLAGFGDAVVFIHDSYAHVKRHALANGFARVDGILLDLGFSSAHVDDPGRGFSFQHNGPLDMRYNQSRGETAADIVNAWSEDELARVFRQYGEEPKAREIAQAIIARRKERLFEQTQDLSECVQKVIPRRGKIHPATRVFQALRMAVNDELGELSRALPDLIDLLQPGGRIAVISFHSLEDRVIKTFLKERRDLSMVTRRPIVPTREEITRNPRSRSAKLRVAQKV